MIVLSRNRTSGSLLLLLLVLRTGQPLLLVELPLPPVLVLLYVWHQLVHEALHGPVGGDVLGLVDRNLGD